MEKIFFFFLVILDLIKKKTMIIIITKNGCGDIFIVSNYLDGGSFAFCGFFPLIIIVKALSHKNCVYVCAVETERNFVSSNSILRIIISRCVGLNWVFSGVN